MTQIRSPAENTIDLIALKREGGPHKPRPSDFRQAVVDQG